MSILFIAVQCFNCATMQVKQQKKSSNRWSCVICNEKQSVRKIHARGYQAKDVRRFVQGFNALRSETDRSDGSGWGSPRMRGSDDGGSEVRGERKRTDWSEYLDQQPQEDEDNDEEEGGPAVTTELPQKNFGRSFLKRPSNVNQSQTANRSNKMKPNFSKKRQNDAHQGNNGSLKCQRTGMEKTQSKWSKYMDEDEEGGQFGLRFDDVNELLGAESILNGFVVEEEVHPDFI